jgi:S-formylglutathione hydrolase FrmB
VPDFNTALPIVKAFFSLADAIYGVGLTGPKPDFSYWDVNNPLELAKDPVKLQGMKVYFDCGTEDNFGFYVGHKALDELFTKMKYSHTAGLYPGPHGWNFAKDHMQDSLLFHWHAFTGQ